MKNLTEILEKHGLEKEDVKNELGFAEHIYDDCCISYFDSCGDIDSAAYHLVDLESELKMTRPLTLMWIIKILEREKWKSWFYKSVDYHIDSNKFIRSSFC